MEKHIPTNAEIQEACTGFLFNFKLLDRVCEPRKDHQPIIIYGGFVRWITEMLSDKRDITLEAFWKYGTDFDLHANFHSSAIEFLQSIIKLGGFVEYIGRDYDTYIRTNVSVFDIGQLWYKGSYKIWICPSKILKNTVSTDLVSADLVSADLVSTDVVSEDATCKDNDSVENNLKDSSDGNFPPEFLCIDITIGGRYNLDFTVNSMWYPLPICDSFILDVVERNIRINSSYRRLKNFYRLKKLIQRGYTPADLLAHQMYWREIEDDSFTVFCDSSKPSMAFTKEDLIEYDISVLISDVPQHFEYPVYATLLQTKTISRKEVTRDEQINKIITTPYNFPKEALEDLDGKTAIRTSDVDFIMWKIVLLIRYDRSTVLMSGDDLSTVKASRDDPSSAQDDTIPESIPTPDASRTLSKKAPVYLKMKVQAGTQFITSRNAIRAEKVVPLSLHYYSGKEIDLSTLPGCRVESKYMPGFEYKIGVERHYSQDDLRSMRYSKDKFHTSTAVGIYGVLVRDFVDIGCTEREINEIFL